MRKIYNHIDLLGERRLIDIYKHFVEAGTGPESMLDLVQTWAKVNFKTDQQAIDILDKQLGRDTTTGIKKAFDRQQRNQHRARLMRVHPEQDYQHTYFDMFAKCARDQSDLIENIKAYTESYGGSIAKEIEFAKRAINELIERAEQVKADILLQASEPVYYIEGEAQKKQNAEAKASVMLWICDSGENMSPITYRQLERFKKQLDAYADQSTEAALPKILQPAKVYFQRAVEAGYMIEQPGGYKWLSKISRLAYFGYMIELKLKLGNYPEKAMQTAFGVPNRLSSNADSALGAKKDQEWRQEIKLLFE
jgi:hypothetical protein